MTGRRWCWIGIVLLLAACEGRTMKPGSASELTRAISQPSPQSADMVLDKLKKEGGDTWKSDSTPKPTRIIVAIEASQDINPDSEERPSPVVLRIYELKSLTAFNGADFVTLYEKDKTLLGSDLVRKEEIVLQPGGKKNIQIEASGDTRAVGIFAAFRQYEKGQWKAAATVPPSETTVVPVLVKDADLKIQQTYKKLK